jgi:hypothetical protein
MTLLALQGVVSFLLLISFSIWAGGVNSHSSDPATLAALYLAVVNGDGTITPYSAGPYFTFGPGFALAIVSFLLSPASAALFFWKKDEAAHAEPAAAAAAESGGGASADGAAAIADAYPMPPAAAPPPGLPSAGLPGQAAYVPTPYGGEDVKY